MADPKKKDETKAADPVAQQGGAQSDGSASSAQQDGAAQPAAPAKPLDVAVTTPEENLVISERMADHPLCSFDEPYFLDLLQHSLSLSVTEKKRVVDAIPTLSQFQIDELTKVFLDEREEFRKLMDKERDTILDLVSKQSYGWKELVAVYRMEDEQKLAASADAAKEDEIRKAAGL